MVSRTLVTVLLEPTTLNTHRPSLNRAYTVIWPDLGHLGVKNLLDLGHFGIKNLPDLLVLQDTGMRSSGNIHVTH